MSFVKNNMSKIHLNNFIRNNASNNNVFYRWIFKLNIK